MRGPEADACVGSHRTTYLPAENFSCVDLSMHRSTRVDTSNEFFLISLENKSNCSFLAFCLEVFPLKGGHLPLP